MKAEVKKYKNGSVLIYVSCLDKDFFDSEEYIIKLIENGFTIQKPNLSYVGKTYKIMRKKNNLSTITGNREMENGTYILDESSDEDTSIFINEDYLEK